MHNYIRLCRDARPGFHRGAALAAALLGVGLLIAVGCRTDWEAVRRSAAESYRGDLQQATQALLDRCPAGLALTQCVALARERNTQVLAGQLAERLAQLDRNAAFSAFLPQVQLNYDTLSLSDPPAVKFDNMEISMQDQSLRRSSVQILQPLFAPSAWLLYRSAARGAEIAGLARVRAEQMVELATVTLFYQCLAQQEEVERLDQEAAAARQWFRDAEAFSAAGYATTSDVSRARALHLERERQCAGARRDSRQAQARLLQAMDLWPLAEMTLQRESPPDAADLRCTVRTPGLEPHELTFDELLHGPVEDWMFHAMLSRAEMQSQDRSIALRRNEVIRALTLFLPSLMGFANYYTTSDSYTVNQQYWGTGLQASLSAFVGFRDVNAYLQARQAVKAAYVAREETALMVLLQVIEAHKTLRDAQDNLEVAEAAADAAERTLADLDSQYHSGLVELSRLLDAQATCSGAVARRRSAGFARAVALHAFQNVVGGNLEVSLP